LILEQVGEPCDGSAIFPSGLFCKQLGRYKSNLIASKSVAIIFLAPRFDGDMGEEYWRERERDY
jgi:hypothetical protein